MQRKEVRKVNRKKFELVLYSYIEKYESLPDIKKYNFSKSTLSYHLKKLKLKNLVFSPSYGVWKIRPQKEVRKIIVSESNPRKLIRIHSCQFTVKLPRFEYWHRLKFYLEKKGVEYYTTKKNAIKIEFKGCNFHIFKKSIVFYLPSSWNFFDSSPKVCENLALGAGRDVLDKFRRFLGIDFRIQGDYKLLLVRSHKAWINNEMAKEVQSKGESIFIKDKGKLWLITDKSFNIDELEFVDHKESVRDINVVLEPFLNTLRRKPDLLGNVESDIERMKKIIHNQQNIINYLVEKEQKSVNLDKFKY